MFMVLCADSDDTLLPYYDSGTTFTRIVTPEGELLRADY